MAQSIQARFGDTVRANFNLVFKRAEVARLKDPENFTRAGFQMVCRTRAAQVSAIGGTTDSGPVRCKTQNITFDDEPIEVDFVFDDPKTFQNNDVWELSFCYLGDSGNFPPADGGHPRKHLMGTVQLVT